MLIRKMPPYLVFNTETPEGGGNGTPQQTQEPAKPEIDGEVFNFPLATPLTAMSPEQVAEYWRHEAKKAHKIVKPYAKLGSPDDVAQKIAELDAARAGQLSEEERAKLALRQEGETAGYTAARDAFAVPAITTMLASRVRGASESFEDASARVTAALEFVDVQKFITDDGKGLDAAKVEQFAGSLASSSPENNESPANSDPLHTVLGHSTPAPQGSAGSVDAYRQQVRERLSPKQ